ncbi:1376_t:CDS:2 [Ambispora gerdemannii]|uniref:1376_t:CDS:1 n=1 Tax=Ambispora gerdemannii TaxID=144530 RepID=A0A9N9DLC8_9GLOM|nr:1376_t:CDS:2 [Ambispora gerdemannii]
MSNQEKLPWPVTKKRKSQEVPEDNQECMKKHIIDSKSKRVKVTANATKDLLIATRSAFSRSADPARIVGREMEHAKITKFLQTTISDHIPGRLYIAGSPGTGKTALVHAVCRELKLRDIEGLQIVEINCNTVQPKNLYFELVKKLSGVEVKKRVDAQRDELFGFYDLSNSIIYSVIVMDEVDNLFEKDSSLIYSLFEYSALSDGKMTLIAIANEINLDKRLLSRLSAKNVTVESLTFKSYRPSEISAIIDDRLKSVANNSLIELQAVELCARKVAFEGGDVRQAMELCMLALQSLDKKNNDKNDEIGKVTLAEMSKILSNAFVTNKAVQRLRELTIHQQAMLCSLILMKRNGNTSTTQAKLFTFYQNLCKKYSAPLINQTQFPDLITACESNGLLKFGRAKRNEDRKIITNILENDLREAIKDVPHIKNFLK